MTTTVSIPMPSCMPLRVFQRRRARRLACWNAGLWAVGNGLTSSTLVIYLALELGVPGIGLGVSLIKAAPQLAGILRVPASALIGRMADRKRFCLGAYFLSAAVLLALPAAAVPGGLPDAWLSLAGIVGLWCLYHLMEYIANVALWSWLADLVPVRVRGRFLGRRERWMVAGQASAMLAAAAFSGVWNWAYPKEQVPGMVWLGYAVPAVLGACFMLVALLPLATLPRAASQGSSKCRTPLGSIIAPLFDPRFWPLLVFGCWFSFFNGVTQSAQELYPRRVLGIGLAVFLVLMTGMRLGQLALSPWLGRTADRIGNQPVMLVSLPIVASGLLFYLAATPDQPLWFAGAWVAWIAFAGINVCLPNLILKLAPADVRAAYVAAYYGLTGVCVAASTILGGMLLDYVSDRTFSWFGFRRKSLFSNAH